MSLSKAEVKFIHDTLLTRVQPQNAIEGAKIVEVATKMALHFHPELAGQLPPDSPLLEANNQGGKAPEEKGKPGKKGAKDASKANGKGKEASAA